MVDEGQFLCIAVFKPVDEGVIELINHCIVAPNKFMNLDNDHH